MIRGWIWRITTTILKKRRSKIKKRSVAIYAPFLFLLIRDRIEIC